MPRKTAATKGSHSPIQSKKQELERHADQLRAQLSQTRDFLDKAPAMIAEVQRKQQRAIIERYHRPSPIEGPADFRLEFVRNRNTKPPKRLRRERSKAPFVTLLLLVGFCIVVYYGWHVLWQS